MKNAMLGTEAKTEDIVSLSTAAQQFINDWIKRYPPTQKRSGVFEALRFVQEENGGYLSEALMKAVATFLDMPAIAVFEVASFYMMFNLNPIGKKLIGICTNISCMLNGAEKILEHTKEKLHINLGQTTADGEFTLHEVECLGACVAAPVCMINKQYHENLSIEKMDKLLERESHAE